MPKVKRVFDLDNDRGSALEAARSAARELGWPARLDGEVLTVREDPAGLCCAMAPVKAELRFDSAGHRTRVRLVVSVPGFGPGPRGQLIDRANGLEQRIRRWSSTREAAA